MKDLVIAVNKVPFPPDSANAVNQERAYSRYLYIKPTWCRIERLGMACDYPNGQLLRDASKELGGKLHLPFLREIVDWVYDNTEAEWIGVMNTDTLITPLLFTRLQEMPSTTNAVLVAVADINYPEQEVGQHRREDWHSYDIALFKRELWAEIRYEIPDCVLGAKSWDGAWFWWLIRRHGVNLTRLRNQECLHLVHRADWRENKDRPPDLYNDQIFRELEL
jgi:hypothetical protein